MPYYIRSYIILAYDGIAAALAFALALLIRYEGLPPVDSHILLSFAAPYALLTVSTFAFMRIHSSVFRYISGRDLLHLAHGITICIMVISALLFITIRMENFPRSALIILWFIHLALATAPRLLPRLWRERKRTTKTQNLQNALIIGANDSTDLFLRELARSNTPPCTVSAIMDESSYKIGRTMHGITVEGGINNFARALDKLIAKHGRIDIIILTEPSQAKIDGLLDIARSRNISVRRLPSISSLDNGENLTNLKPVAIEDLLGRQSRQLNMQPIKELVSGKKVIVTGAGGSIGSEICRQIASHHPAELILAEQSEFALYDIDLELTNIAPDISKKAVLIDIRNKEKTEELISNSKPDVIFHAAAYKHVPLVEANPIAGIETNLFGTATVADIACRHKVPNMVVISTDKAVNPTNIMGATKRAAEIYCQNHAGVNGFKTNFITVRFGNVLGSSGSVVPLFRKQITAGGPLTVTDKRAERYFMTIPEAVQLVLRAAALREEAAASVLMLDMGEPVKIWHMAEEMVRLSGLVPHVDIEIKEVGLRPGEKIKEELWYKQEVMTPTSVEEVFCVTPVKISADKLEKMMHNLHTTCANQDNAKAVLALSEMVGEYKAADNSPYAAKK